MLSLVKSSNLFKQACHTGVKTLQTLTEGLSLHHIYPVNSAETSANKGNVTLLDLESHTHA